MEDLRFNRPERMRLNKSYVVEAQFGVPAQPVLGNVGQTVTRRVAVPASRLVRVDLVADDFDIVKLHHVDDQLLTPGTTAMWSWRVTPTRETDQSKLILQVFGVMRQAGYTGEVLIKTYQEDIPVEVTTMDRFELGARAFLSRWDIIAGIFGAIGGAWVFFHNIMKLFTGRRSATA